jgi:hypothetical protein
LAFGASFATWHPDFRKVVRAGAAWLLALALLNFTLRGIGFNLLDLAVASSRNGN